MLTAFLLAVSTACSAPAPIAVTGGYAELTQGVQALRDPSRELSLREAASAARCADYEAIDGVPRFGPTGDGVWLRFRVSLPTSATDNWRLRVNYAPLKHVCVYWPLSGEGYSRTCGGEHPEAIGPSWNGGYTLPLPAGLDSTREIYVYSESGSWLKVPLEIGNAGMLLQKESGLQFSWGLYFGILMALVMYSAMVAYSAADRGYAFFSLHFAAFTLGVMAWQGRFMDLGLPSWTASHLGLAALFAFVALGAGFYRPFLQTKRHTPRLHRLLAFIGWGMAPVVLLALFAPRWALPVGALLSLAWFPTVTAAATIRAAQGYRPALYVIGAMAPLLLGGFMRSVELLGLSTATIEFTNILVRFGAIIGASFLVLGLGQRVREVASERERLDQLSAANQQVSLHRARYDEITGLPNREKYAEDLRERLLRAMRANEELAIITVGLDHFRSINHALGHDAGDAVLREVAQRLRQSLAKNELLARIGPDIFGLVLSGSRGERPTLAQLVDRCADLQERISEPLRHGEGARLGASIGLAVYPEHGVTADLLMRHSDAALYKAKDLGGGALEMFQPELLRHAGRHLRLSKELRTALERGEFELHYQPIVSLVDGQLVSLEALIRWRRPDGTQVPPDQFIPVAESADLIAPISEWVFHEACQQLADWRDRNIGPRRVSVNVSPRQFRLPGLVDSVSHALASAGLPGEALDLEITEGVVVENLESTGRTLRELRKHDIGVSVDDFGVGFSSLSYLRSLPVTGLKIDRSFLRGIPDEAEANTVITAMIGLGRDLGLKVIAEGIEENVQREFLLARGCLYGQGFMFCKPLNATDLEVWLQNRDLTLAVA